MLPTNPTNGQKYEVNNFKKIFDSAINAWKSVPSTSGSSIKFGTSKPLNSYGKDGDIFIVPQSAPKKVPITVVVNFDGSQAPYQVYTDPKNTIGYPAMGSVSNSVDIYVFMIEKLSTSDTSSLNPSITTGYEIIYGPKTTLTSTSPSITLNIDKVDFTFDSKMILTQGGVSLYTLDTHDAKGNLVISNAMLTVVENAYGSGTMNIASTSYVSNPKKDYVKINGSWVDNNPVKILSSVPKLSDTLNDPDGTVYYVKGKQLKV